MDPAGGGGLLCRGVGPDLALALPPAPLKSVPLGRLFPVVCIGYFGNNVYPARAGEVIRAFVLRRNEGISVSASFATIIVERVFDGLVMLLFVFFALPFVDFEQIPAIYRVTVVVASAAFFIALAVFLWMALDPQRFSRVYHFFSDRLVPARFRGPLDGFVERFMSGLSFLRSGRDVLMVFVTSLVIWLLETVKYWLIMQGFTFVVSFVGLMLMNGVVNLTTTLPSAPGYIGTFEVGAKVLAARCGCGDGAGLYAGPARRAVAADHAAGRLLHVARGREVAGLRCA